MISRAMISFTVEESKRDERRELLDLTQLSRPSVQRALGSCLVELEHQIARYWPEDELQCLHLVRTVVGGSQRA